MKKVGYLCLFLFMNLELYVAAPMTIPVWKWMLTFNVGIILGGLGLWLAFIRKEGNSDAKKPKA